MVVCIFGGAWGSGIPYCDGEKLWEKVCLVGESLSSLEPPAYALFPIDGRIRAEYFAWRTVHRRIFRVNLKPLWLRQAAAWKCLSRYKPYSLVEDLYP